MTPEEHYREAERLVAVISDVDGTPYGEKLPDGRQHDQEYTNATIALAQVHATLATARAPREAADEVAREQRERVRS